MKKKHPRQVYIAKCIGPTGQPLGAYKIGCSYDRDPRMEAVTSCLPFTLELAATSPGGFFMEAVCHLHLRKHRIAGEYFHANDVAA